MTTIFGPSWADLTLDDVRRYLEQADDEPLLWEAKGTRLDPSEIRRQVCAFANSHEGGYLILGAEPAGGDDPEARWVLDAVTFPDEPRTWIANVIGDLTAGVRPRPDFDVQPWEAPNGHVVVVWVTPTSTPPCIANGTVYERLPGKTQTVRDPLRLADLFARGNAAHREAQARADELRTLSSWTDSAARRDASKRLEYRWPLPPMSSTATPSTTRTSGSLSGSPRPATRRISRLVSFGRASPRRSGASYATARRGFRPGWGGGPDAVMWSQEALTWRHQTSGMLDSITVVRASWDGAAASGAKLATEDVYPDTLVTARISREWERADDLVRRLGGFGNVYATVLVVEGRFPRRTDDGHILMPHAAGRRGAARRQPRSGTDPSGREHGRGAVAGAAQLMSEA